MDELTETGYEAFIMKATIPESGTFYRVSVGRFESREEALALAKELREKKGIDTFVRAGRGKKLDKGYIAED